MEQGKQQSPRFRLNLSAVRGSEMPGPGTYRINTGRSPGRQTPGPYTPSTSFGSPKTTPRALAAAVALAAQRVNSPRSLAATARSVPSRGHCTAISIGSPAQRGERRQYPWTLVRSGSAEDPPATGSDTLGSSSRKWQDASAAIDHSAAVQAGNLWHDSNDRSSADLSGSPNPSSTLGGHAWSFGPPGGLAKGRERRRSREGNVYISAQHTAVDPGTLVASHIPGAGAYNIEGKMEHLSTHTGSGTPRFVAGNRKAGAKLYVSPEHCKADPSLTCSPGPGTATLNLMGSISSSVFGRAPPASPRFGPAPSPRSKAPYISKQHEVTRAGQDSPGPAAYDATSAARAVLDDRRTAHFGTSERDINATKPSSNPGPGAYHPDEAKSLVFASGKSFSMGATGHDAPSGSAPTATPGAGTYDIGLADHQRFKNPGIATVTGKLQHGGIEVETCSPGPAAYIPIGPAEGMGFAADLQWERRVTEAYIRSQQHNINIESAKLVMGSNGHQYQAIDLVLRQHSLAASKYTESHKKGAHHGIAAKSHGSRSIRRSAADNRLLTGSKGLSNSGNVFLSRTGSARSVESTLFRKIVEEKVLGKQASKQ